ncbi:MAG TPA: hypothetical protein VEC39_07840 [Vicinamibacterales bacterium]|nr:hypothetical protein [Vicinamibacterales bacterium]
MAIIEKTPSRLVIKYKPWLESLIGAAFVAGGVWAFNGGERSFGAGFIVAGVALIVGVAAIVTTTFDRGTGKLTRSRRGLVRRTTASYPLAEIREVRVRATHSGDGPSKSYSLVVVMRDRTRVPVNFGFSSGKADKEQLAAEIRRFLGLPDAPELGEFGLRDMYNLLRPSQGEERRKDGA